ncbi:MAG: hypothetical protein CVU39_01625 [Chloroflexi bacterium HGW-Chloroflexi-10]|nr:MAG: hypothetical protein CVU39_01625 [Chloroflexi bacterium HGW-Chloroflexi-10]
MEFKFEIGYAITGLAALIFYLRLAQLRGKKRRLARENAANIMKMPKGKKQKEKILEMEKKKNLPSMEIGSWPIAIIAIVLMLAAVVVKSNTTLDLPALVEQYWWVGSSLGFILFIFAFK